MGLDFLLITFLEIDKLFCHMTNLFVTLQTIYSLLNYYSTVTDFAKLRG